MFGSKILVLSNELVTEKVSKEVSKKINQFELFLTKNISAYLNINNETYNLNDIFII